MLFIKRTKNQNYTHETICFDNNSFLELSHEIENNLVAIRSAAGTLKKNLDLGELKTEINRTSIDKNLNTINKMVNDALKNIEIFSLFASTEFGFNNLSTEQVSIKELVRNVIAEFPYKSSVYKELFKINENSEDILIKINKKLFELTLMALLKMLVNSIDLNRKSTIQIYINRDSLKKNITFYFHKKEWSNKHKSVFELGLPEKLDRGYYLIKKIIGYIPIEINYFISEGHFVFEIGFS